MDTFKVKLYEKGTGKHIGTRHHKTTAEIAEMKKIFKELDIKIIKDPAPPQPTPAETEIEEELNA